MSTSDSQQLFVGNLPHDCTEDHLTELFGKYGKVKDESTPPHLLFKRFKDYNMLRVHNQMLISRLEGD